MTNLRMKKILNKFLLVIYLENKKLKVKFEETKVKFEETKVKLKTKNEGNVPLSIILNGLPKFDFEKFNRSKSEYKIGIIASNTSNRKEISKKILFEITLLTLESLKLNMDKINLKSSKLFNKTTYFDNKLITFSSENIIQHLVYDYFTDIFDILELTRYINFFDTTSIIKKKTKSS